MERILNFIHGLILWTFTLSALIFVDIPAKIIGCIIILVYATFDAIIYPLVKGADQPDWFYNLFNYVTHKDKSLCKLVYKLWR